MKPTKNLALPLSWLFAILAGMFALSTPAFAYDDDTHFNMTYVLLRSVGFSPEDALIVAAVDEGMDDSSDTVAVKCIIPHPRQEWLWHALDRKGKMSARGIIERRNELFQEALREPLRRNKLIRLGVFFHYQQDTWAHRHHGKPNHLSRDDYTPFTTPFGHGFYGHVPDEPPDDPVAALMNLEDGIVFARTFLKQGLGEEPNPFLAEYMPEGGNVFTGWIDKRKGKYFNQIDLTGAVPDSSRKYLLDLIQAQINVYKRILNFFPHYLFRHTPNVANVDKSREELKKVCDSYAPYRGANTINIPTTAEKVNAGFTHLKTDVLLKFPLPDTGPPAGMN